MMLMMLVIILSTLRMCRDYLVVFLLLILLQVLIRPPSVLWSCYLPLQFSPPLSSRQSWNSKPCLNISSMLSREGREATCHHCQALATRSRSKLVASPPNIQESNWLDFSRYSWYQPFHLHA